MKIVVFEVETREAPSFDALRGTHEVTIVESALEVDNAGEFAAAGLDVLPDEPLIREEAELICSIFCNQHDLRNLVADHVLLRMRNVIVTPHSAFNTREAVGRITQTTVENIEAFAAGRTRNVVAGSAGAANGEDTAERN